MHPLDRRALCADLGALAVAAAGHAQANEAADLDGTWGGALNRLTAQVIIVGASVVGFFWRDDYLDARDANSRAMAEVCLSPSKGATRRPAGDHDGQAVELHHGLGHDPRARRRGTLRRGDAAWRSRHRIIVAGSPHSHP
jgi:hypothetical protein